MAHSPISTAESKLPWPDDPTLLTEADLLWWGDNPNSNCRDLFWWIHHTFNSNAVPGYQCEGIAQRVLEGVLTERAGTTVTDVWGFVDYCRKKRASKAWLAACWNEMLNRLVYDVPKALRKDPGWATELS